MTDIVERMEEHAEWHHRNGDEYTASMIRKAADEIERLRADRDAVRAEAERLRAALQAWLDTDDAGDGHACIHAIAAALAAAVEEAVRHEP